MLARPLPIPLGLIEFLAGQVFVFREVVGAQRLGSLVFLAEPFAEIDQLAALRAERTHRRRVEIIGLPADGAGEFGWHGLKIDEKKAASQMVWRSVGQSRLDTVRGGVLSFA